MSKEDPTNTLDDGITWFRQGEATDHASLIAVLTNANCLGLDFAEEAFMAIACDVAALDSTIDSSETLNPRIFRLVLRGIETRALAAAGLAERLGQSRQSSHEPERTMANSQALACIERNVSDVIAFFGQTPSLDEREKAAPLHSLAAALADLRLLREGTLVGSETVLEAAE